MYVYLRSSWVSVIILGVLLIISQQLSSFLSLGITCMLIGAYVSHICTSKALYVLANRKGINDLTSLSKEEKIEVKLYPLMETLIITSLLIFRVYVDSLMISWIMFAVGAGLLVILHLKRNIEELKYYRF